MTDVTCDVFEDAADDLALGHTSEPARAALFAHASACARCSALLRDLSATVDRVLELAPEAEPPVGFETRALAAMGSRARHRPRAPQRRRPRSRLVGMAAAFVAVGLLAGLGITRVMDTTARPAAADAGRIVAADGASLGSAELYRQPHARIVVVFDAPKTWRGAWSCELQRNDGSWATVGTWSASDAPTGAWTAPIAADLARAPAMRIRAADGSVIATARFG